ncbi:hypothetical protein HED22_10715 [Thalassospira sp. HF15]|uniref:hypothetical protein n=1 Tax=Thalassospira sp. HF15 TaxID=2722755 RepID=UPI001431672D|nr:hypothetical protein [Thalassospira sp. HF15]NIY76117.1 hypothetical protein [Thalassospira sp. HF15]
MGSTGSGSFSDYPGSSGRSGGSGSGSEDGNGGQGDRCERAFSIALEDVNHSGYFTSHNTVPPVGTKVVLVHNKRLVAQTTSGDDVGNLPTKMNYLAACMRGGYSYEGEVISSSVGAVAKVTVDFAPK